ALAAGTLGVGPGAAHGAEFWRASVFEDRGGVVGQAELWVSSHLISTLGADILAVFLFVAGLILVTGAGVAGVVRATGTRVADTTRVIRRTPASASAARRPATAAARARAGERLTAGPEPVEPLLPPEPDTSELVVRATHVEAPPISEDPIDPEEPEENSFPEPEPPSEAPAPVAAEDLTPQGRYRGSITDDPSFVWRLPSARFLV